MLYLFQQLIDITSSLPCRWYIVNSEIKQYEYRVYADRKVRENHRQKSGKSGRVWEFEKNIVPGQGKSGKIVLPKYLIRVVH